MIKRIPAFASLLILTITFSAFYVFLVAQTDFVESFKLKTIDTLFAFRAKTSPPSSHLKDLVVVGVDDESFKIMNRAWPWGREVFAFFVEKLNVHNPRIIAMDFVFGGVGPDPKVDEWLAKTFQDSGRVILASYIGPNGTLMQPHRIFMDAALSLGLVDKLQDVDGVSRKTRPLIKNDAADSFSFGVEAAYRSQGADPMDFVRAEDRGVQFFSVSDSADASAAPPVMAQADPGGQAWLSYRYTTDRFRYVSFGRIVRGEVPPGVLEGKVVIVGPVSPILHDIHPTPLGRMPGVFANANEIMAMLDRDFIWEPFRDTSPWFALIIGILFTLLIYNLAFGFQLLVYILASVLFYCVSATLFCHRNILIDPLTPLIVLALNFMTVASWKALKTFLDNIALQRQVITDSLTGLYGHRFLTLKLGSIFLHSAQMKSEFCVAMLDADHFKKVNDTYGHDIGNVVLVAITKVMKQHVRRQDVAARFGGEEFAIVLVGTDTKGARECMERIRKSIEELEFNSDKGKFKVTISSGLVSNQNPAVRNSDDMLKLADKALYEAKTQGRNRVCAA